MTNLKRMMTLLPCAICGGTLVLAADLTAASIEICQQEANTAVAMTAAGPQGRADYLLALAANEQRTCAVEPSLKACSIARLELAQTRKIVLDIERGKTPEQIETTCLVVRGVTSKDQANYKLKITCQQLSADAAEMAAAGLQDRVQALQRIAKQEALACGTPPTIPDCAEWKKTLRLAREISVGIERGVTPEQMNRACLASKGATVLP